MQKINMVSITIKTTICNTIIFEETPGNKLEGRKYITGVKKRLLS